MQKPLTAAVAESTHNFGAHTVQLVIRLSQGFGAYRVLLPLANMHLLQALLDISFVHFVQLLSTDRTQAQAKNNLIFTECKTVTQNV